MRDETTLSELYDRDPFKFTEQDEDTLIKYYRTKYQSFTITGKAKPDKPEIDLKDLGLL